MSAIQLGADAATAASFVALAGASYAVYRVTSAWYRRSLGSRRQWTRRFNQLACGVTEEYLRELLGTPAFGQLYGPHGVRLIFRTPHAWVLADHSREKGLLAFSITTTDKKFTPDLRHLTFEQITGKLGDLAFGDVTAGVMTGCRLFIGARRFGYSEAFYFGNPGGYQTFVLTFNDVSTVGTLPWDLLRSMQPGFAEGNLFREGDHLPQRAGHVSDADVDRFRKISKPNTLTVLGPMAPTAREYDHFGVESDLVRLLRPWQ